MVQTFQESLLISFHICWYDHLILLCQIAFRVICCLSLQKSGLLRIMSNNLSLYPYFNSPLLLCSTALWVLTILDVIVVGCLTASLSLLMWIPMLCKCHKNVSDYMVLLWNLNKYWVPLWEENKASSESVTSTVYYTGITIHLTI